jgi:LmbE family N-acetylglucosaminyl deacetylase
MTSARSARIGWTLSGAVLGAAAVLLLPPALQSVRPAAAAPAVIPNDGKLRVIVFGAHPDDPELRAAGVAANWAAAGHHVKFVSSTNGDIGHWQMAGGPLAQRRYDEVQRCAKILGITTDVLDIHDGELLPTLENRRTYTRRIRDWKADIVISHRPNDYHPDHRYVGVLAQDAAYMVTVPFFCPDTPYLTRNPVFLYTEDRFQKPNPFQADVVVGIDESIQKTLEVVETLVSQFYEGGANGGPANIPSDDEGKARRKKAVRDGFDARFSGTANRFRKELQGWYGKERGDQIKYAEAFEVCEYGRQPSKDELKKLFPF